MGRSISLLCLACSLVACGGSTQLHAEGSDRAPSAKADIEVELEGSHNDLDLEVHDLPPPEEIDRRFSRYGVWMIRANGEIHRLGFLRYQDDIEYGDLETQSPLEPIEIVVTAEPDEDVVTPSHAVILRRMVP